jgi:hypothetical protein
MLRGSDFPHECPGDDCAVCLYVWRKSEAEDCGDWKLKRRFRGCECSWCLQSLGERRRVRGSYARPLEPDATPASVVVERMTGLPHGKLYHTPPQPGTPN